MGNLLSPPIPVMLNIVAPNIALMADAFFHKQVGQPVCFVEALIFPGSLPANQDNMSIVANMLQRITVQIVNIGQRIVKIDLFGAAVTTTSIFDIVTPAHAQGIVENMGKFKSEIGRMISTQAAPGQANFNIGCPAIEADGGYEVA